MKQWQQKWKLLPRFCASMIPSINISIVSDTWELRCGMCMKNNFCSYAVAPSALLLSISMLLIYSHHILIVHLSCFSNDTHKLLFCNQHSLILPHHFTRYNIIIPLFYSFLCCCLLVLFSGCCFIYLNKYFFPSLCVSFLFLCFSNDGKDGGEYYNKQQVIAPP